MKPIVTAILLSWKREPNMPRIVKAIRSQTVPVEIWLIANSSDFSGDLNIAIDNCDRYVYIPWNAGEWARYVFASRVETEYCMFQDDDFMLGDPDFLADAIRLHGDYCPAAILGTAGRNLRRNPPHYAPDIKEGRAAIIKGHFQLFRPGIVRRAHIPNHPSASDIQWSLDIGGGEPVHYVAYELAQRLEELDRHGVGYEFRPDHYAEREAVCAAWLEEKRYA